MAKDPFESIAPLIKYNAHNGPWGIIAFPANVYQRKEAQSRVYDPKSNHHNSWVVEIVP